MNRLNLAQSWSLETNAWFGIGASRRLPEWLSARGCVRPSLVVDEAVAVLPTTQTLLAGWNAQGMRLVKTHLAHSTQEPDYAYLDEAAETFRGVETDLIIGMGGGSTLDLAKGIGLLLRNDGPSLAYRGMDRVRHPGVPVVLLPTTAGSGSEVTATASFIDRTSRTKLGINGRHVGCLLSVLDPELLASCPVWVTIGSGLDALVHAVEAVTATTAHAVSVLFGVEAARLLFAGLPMAVREPSNLEARANTFLGSHYAGMAMRNVGGGPASGISYPLGVHHGVPHGFAGGILLPHVVRFNVANGYTGYAQLSERLDHVPARSRVSDADKAAAFEEACWALYDDLGAPTGLTRWGVRRQDVERLVDLTVTQRQANLHVNPVPCGRDEVTALLEAVTE
ncbi:MAG: iron-containing alcohol dehydrogenase [Candidatus Omnitrophica bacterium]|nr:iron-containing alcohol dehydrogenase [Candidatus Omnitrophota bacterium]